MFKLIKEKELTGYASIDNPHEIGESFISRNPIIPNMSVYSALKLLNLGNMNMEAVDHFDESISYKQLIEDTKTLSLALRELGVKKGDIVPISVPNLYQGIITFLACNRIGAVTTFLNPNAGVDEIKQYLNLFESELFFNFNKDEEQNKEYRKGTGVRQIITINKSRVDNLSLTENYREINKGEDIDFSTIGNFAKYQRDLPIIGNKTNDAIILYTSGTTGKPKSVLLSNKNILAVATYLKNSSHIKKNVDNKTLVCVPFSYPYGFITSTLLTLMSGKFAILAPDIGPSTISKYLKKQPNIIFGSPALLELISKYSDKDIDLSSISTFISGGDFLTPKMNKKGQAFFEEHNASVQICNGSGNAETCGSGTNPVGQELRIETAGKPLVGCKCMIADPDMLEKGTIVEKKYYEEGTLCISGDNVFEGYFKDPKKTKTSMFTYNGREYFITGTRGFLDEKGYFTITGRASRFFINSSLNKVYLDRIQNIISLNQYVDTCAVVKVEDEENLYVNKVYIVLKKEYKNNQEILEQIKEMIKEPIISDEEVYQLKSFEIPTYYEIVDNIPRKVPSDKIDYQKLEEDAKNKIPKGKSFKKQV